MPEVQCKGAAIACNYGLVLVCDYDIQRHAQISLADVGDFLPVDPIAGVAKAVYVRGIPAAFEIIDSSAWRVDLVQNLQFAKEMRI
jgi:hypothetical protein